MNTQEYVSLTHEARQAAVQDSLVKAAASLGEAQQLVQQCCVIVQAGIEAGEIQQTGQLLCHVLDTANGWHGLNSKRLAKYVNHHAQGFRCHYSKKHAAFKFSIKKEEGTPIFPIEGNWYDFEGSDTSTKATSTPRERIYKNVLALLKEQSELQDAEIIEEFQLMLVKARTELETQPGIGKSVPVAEPSEL